MFKLNPIYCCIGAVCSVFTISNVCAADAKLPNGFIVSKDVKHDVSLPLRYLQGKPNLLNKQASIKQVLSNEVSDKPTHVEESLLIPLAGFQGLGVGLGNYQPSTVPPDTNGTVGMMQYAQFVNSDIAVFDKTTGQVAAGFPKPANSIWAGFGGFCEANAGGLLTMKYDQLAHRWVFSQYANGNIVTGPFFHCVAVSTSEDVTGTYYRYAFQLDAFSTFARSALWPDAYYFSFDMLGRVAVGPRACALERDKMLVGEPASSICKQLTAQQIGDLLPADLEGEGLPPTGNPEYYMGLADADELVLYKFHVDFAFPINSTLTSINIQVNNYTPACLGSDGRNCAIQPNTTNKLDVASSRLARFIYRQFDDYGSMVTSHPVDGPQPKYAPAIRWYEFRVLKNTPTFNPIVYQQATWAPNSMNRFLSSISIDKAGGIAIGYTVTSSLVFPSLELGSRVASDPLGTLTLQPLVTGLGSQVDGVSNWGTISKMSIDPVDNCTFWYTNEYLKTTGSFNWSTFIVHFKLAGCS